MPRTAQANEQIREDTTEKIMQAAKRVFARKGMAARIEEVAAEAGISKGLAYHYFPSKEAIFVALMKRMTRSPEELELIAQQIPGTHAERLNQIILSMVGRRRADPEFYQFFSRAMADESLPADIRQDVYAQGLHMRKILRRLIVEGQATGDVAKDDPDELVQVIMACLDGLSRIGYSSPGGAGSHMPDGRMILRMLKPDRSEE